MKNDHKNRRNVSPKSRDASAEPGVTDQTCGIIMPISALDGCSEQHWADVLEIIQSSIEAAGFKPNLVSNADEVGIIQKRIIQNLYDNPIVVCDVSGKNPNCMFELGLRLAFDKPTIIVKDDKTTYSFDTAPIEHIEYPRDLRYASIVEFKETLAEKILSTHKKASEDASYTTFLKNFGTFTVAKLDTKEVDKEEFILEELRSLRELITTRSLTPSRTRPLSSRPHDCLCVRTIGHKFPDALGPTLISKLGLEGVSVKPVGTAHYHVDLMGDNLNRPKDIVDMGLPFVRSARWFGSDGRVISQAHRDDTKSLE